MRISEEYNQSPKFFLPHNVELSIRELMDIFLSYRIIRTIGRHTNAYVREKANILRDLIDSETFSIIY